MQHISNQTGLFLAFHLAVGSIVAWLAVCGLLMHCIAFLLLLLFVGEKPPVDSNSFFLDKRDLMLKVTCFFSDVFFSAILIADGI